MDTAKIEAGVRLILEGIGEDPEREGLRETPARVARMYEEVLGGLEEDPSRHFDVTFDEGHEEIVLVGDIPFFSMCEHHLAPLVDGFAKRPQVQERLTGQIADTLVEALHPAGVIVVLEAEHMCMSMRGVKKPGAKTTTRAVRGCFETDADARSEALSLIFRH